MKTEYRKSYFFLTPNNIFDEGLKPREFIVYSYLLRCGDARRQSFPSRKDIAKKCCVSIPTVDAALKSLEASGFISITHRNDPANGNHLSHLYTVEKTW